MAVTRREFMIRTAAAAAAGVLLASSRAESTAVSASFDRFQPNWDSLAQYQCPEWFRDAKFGIWAHWNAMCVPEQGNWYARSMYMEGSSDYVYHVATYGHPSKVGFKEIDRLWKAENWDPDALISLYKAAGAKYFVALAQHHDNLDCWDSKFQPWNTTKIGPEKDIVATWAASARNAGLRFGVSCHGSRTWSWMEPAQGADKNGPLAGVPYDGTLTEADGAGTWWNGLDPNDLYAQRHKPMGDDFDHWSNRLGGELPDKAYCEKFYNRTVDLLDKYHPDLLYFDDAVLPLYECSDIGLRIAAYQYNSNLSWHEGKLEAVLNGKDLTDLQQKCLIQDYERGASDVIREFPWQTDTCIGNWFYNKDFHDNHWYKSAETVVRTLVDIVSKNGNLLLSIPLKADGTLDDDEHTFLTQMAGWMSVNSEAIFETRPWKVYGEGRIKSGGSGRFTETAYPYTSDDIRFTTKGGSLYAVALGWPDDGAVLIRTLAGAPAGVVGDVKRVELIGHGPVTFEQTTDGLSVTTPSVKPCDFAYVFKIDGIDLAASNPLAVKAEPIKAAADGTLSLTPDFADLSGAVRLQGGDVTNIGFWSNPADSVSWTIYVGHSGSYQITAKASAVLSSSITFDDGNGDSADLKVQSTGSYYTYSNYTGGVLNVSKPGTLTITAKPTDAASWQPVNLSTVTLTPVPNTIQ